MFNRTSGHGIAGSKNVYSTSAHLGNWREDMIGQELVQEVLSRTNGTGILNSDSSNFGSSMRNRKNSYSTSSQVIGAASRSNNQETGVYDVDNPETCGRSSIRRSGSAGSGKKVRFLTQEELKSKNKEGLNYSMLFAHTTTGNDISHKDRYTSMNRLSSSHFLFENDIAAGSQNIAPITLQSTSNHSQVNLENSMRGTYKKRLNTTRNSNNIKDIYKISDEMLPPVLRSYTRTKSKEAVKEQELGQTRATSSGQASRFLTTQHTPGHNGAPHSAAGRTEMLPSARRQVVISQPIALMQYRGRSV